MLSIGLFLVGAESRAEVSQVSPEDLVLNEILRVRAGEWVGFQSSSGAARSPSFGIAPQLYSLSDYFKLDFLLSFEAFQDTDLSQQILAIDIVGRVRWLPLERGPGISLGVGGQTWLNESTAIEGVLGLNSPPIHLGGGNSLLSLDIFAEYLLLSNPLGLTHGVRAGITFYGP
jgi:hypothetical protein